MGLCPQLPADTRSEVGRWLRLRNCEIRDKRNRKPLHWTWIRGKKKTKDAAMFTLMAFVAVVTFVVLTAVFGIWTSAVSILTTVGLESQSGKEPSDWYRIAAI